MCKMLNDFHNKTNELRSAYLAGQDEEIDNVTENALLFNKNQLNVFGDYIINSKQRTPTKRISSDKLFKPGLSQETIAERVKLKP